LVLRNVNTGAFQVYNIANNQLTGSASLGAVGLDWQLSGFAADPPSGSTGDSSQAAQLTQAMAGFTGSSGAGESLNTATLGADMSQQTRQADRRVTQVRLPNSRKRWLALLVAVAQVRA
jgi:hypothetical protein